MKNPSGFKDSPAFNAVGAAVLGPAHRREGIPCEDAFSIRRRRGLVTIAVSDGIGSCIAAREASQAACRLAHDAAARWFLSRPCRPEVFMKLFAVYLEMWLGDRNPRDFGATLLLAGIRQDGSAEFFQLGDGLICWNLDNGEFGCIARQRPDFGNLVAGTNAVCDLAAWSHASLPSSSRISTLVMATDGVADDLREESLPGFVDTIRREAESLGPAATRHWLRSELLNWTTPNHLDDKTIVACWRATTNE